MEVLVFRIDRHRYALPLSDVHRIVHAVEVTPLPGAPPLVMGAINVEGRILPVLDLRRRLGLPEREIGLADHFLIGRTAQRDVVLVVDEAEGVIDCDPSAVSAAADLVPGIEPFDRILKVDSDLVLVHDLEKFLSLDEWRSLDAAAAPNS